MPDPQRDRRSGARRAAIPTRRTDFSSEQAHLLRCVFVRLCDAIPIAPPRVLTRASHLSLLRRKIGFRFGIEENPAPKNDVIVGIEEKTAHKNMDDPIKCVSDGEKDILERAIGEPGARKLLIERYEKLLFGFILSFAAFSREQAFEIASNSFTAAFQQMQRIPRDGFFLEGLFRQALKEFEGMIPGGRGDLSTIGDFPPPRKESLKIVREALIYLSPEDKAILLLRDQCHFSFERISGILGSQPRAIRSACLGARERLREAVQVVLEKKMRAS